MYAIDIAAKKFEGTSIVKQHRMVNEVLKEEIKGMHGLQVSFFFITAIKCFFKKRNT